MKLILLILIAALVMITGCIGGGVNVDDNNGLQINEFSVDPQVSEVDDTVSFFLDVENVGGTTARCVRAEIFGVDSWYDEFGNPMSYPAIFGGEGFDFFFSNAGGNLRICYRGGLAGDAIEWIINSLGGNVNIETNEQVCYSRNRNDDESWSVYVGSMWGEFTDSLCDAYMQADNPRIYVFPDLTPPSPEQNRPGQFVTREWRFRPPYLPEGVRQNYDVTTRVSYWYSSNAVINIRAFNKAEYQLRQDTGKQIDFTPDIVNSYASPIKITLQRGTSPIIVNQRMQGIELENYLIELQNTGNGFPLPVTSDAYGESGLVFGTIEVRGPGVFFYDCLGQSNTDVVFVDGLTKLRSDNRAPFGCTIGIDRNEWVDRPTDTITLVFNLFYVYYVDAETTATVLGMQEF